MIKDQVQLSDGFKLQTKKAIMSITIFIIVYILIFLLALGLTALCVYGGVMLIITVPRLITIALGIGLASTGFLVVFFLLKFIFKTNKMDRSYLTELVESEQPALFKMIHEIVAEVGTTFPKKIYVSPEVNASVFYDSSFWSMFIPIKKNLVIGLGLVNSIHTDELKAILSHEFGHFSQRTMKVGSYVYNVNQIIFNMLYDNEGFDRVIQKWANMSGYFTIFVIFAGKIVQGIQWILRKMYEFVNKNYLGLSREMEFHADEIAANVTGAEPLKNSLLRMNIADYSFNHVMSYYDGLISKNINSKNIFAEHSFVLGYLAEKDNIDMTNGLPAVTLKELNQFNKSKLVIKNQWASHPSTEERIESLDKTNLQVESTDTSIANNLFVNITELQEKLTEKMFSSVIYEKAPTTNSLDQFQSEFDEEYEKNTFSTIFNGYYSDKNPHNFDMNELATTALRSSYKEFFNDIMVNQVYEGLALEHDIEIIKQISVGTIKIKTFDYDGKKYNQKQSAPLLKSLQEKLDALTVEIKRNDVAIFQFFKQQEYDLLKTNTLEKLYEKFFDFDKEYDTKIAIYSTLSEKLSFISETTPYDQIRDNFNALRAQERTFKQHINEIIEDEKFNSEITDEIKENFESYLSKNWEYFGNEVYMDKNLEMLFGALTNYSYLLSKGFFVNKKEILDFKVSLVEA